MDYKVLQPNYLNVAKITAKAIADNGDLNVLPSEFYKQFTQEDISTFCTREGYYSLPTEELIEFLKNEIGTEEKVIEIAAGNGVYGRELGIVSTDSYLQKLNPQVKLAYEQTQQTIVPYGNDVKPLEAMEAVRKYKPRIIVVAWGTHKFDRKKPLEKGNQYGIEYEKIMAYQSVEKIILIGDLEIHKFNPVHKKATRIIQEDWIVSRSTQNKNAIIIYEKNK